MRPRFTNNPRPYLWLLAATIVAYVFVVYLVLPATWSRIEHEPGLSKRTMVTHNADGIPGGPINIGLIGSREQLVLAFHAAGWDPADPITLRTSLKIVGSVVLDRPYRDAPVSPLYFEGRHEDLAFEKPVGRSADRRQHVRLWLVFDSGAQGHPVWLGSASFDSGVTLSRDTGQITHKIAPNIDQERDDLIRALDQALALCPMWFRSKDSAQRCMAGMAKEIPTTLTERSGLRHSSRKAKELPYRQNSNLPPLSFS